MKPFTTINRLFLKEMFWPFFISLFFLTFVFLMTRIPEITHMVMNYNAGLGSVLLLVVYTIPKFMEFTIPMSVMIAVLLTVMKMEGDNELLAIRSSGISLYRLLLPVFIFCLTGMLLTLWVTFYGVAWGRYSAKLTYQDLIESSPDFALQPRTFYLDIDNIMIYVNGVDVQSRQLTDIFIEDRTTRDLVSIYTAPSGILLADSDRQLYTLRLYDGSINQVDLKNGSSNHTDFKYLDKNIDLGLMASEKTTLDKEPDERNINELIDYIKTNKNSPDPVIHRTAYLQLHENIAVPFACFFLGLLAFSTGIRPVSRKRSAGFGLGILFFLVYYLLLAAGWATGETGRCPPAVAMWTPNLLMGMAGLFLLKKNAAH